jgi:hypothetical protein
MSSTCLFMAVRLLAAVRVDHIVTEIERNVAKGLAHIGTVRRCAVPSARLRAARDDASILDCLRRRQPEPPVFLCANDATESAISLRYGKQFRVESCPVHWGAEGHVLLYICLVRDGGEYSLHQRTARATRAWKLDISSKASSSRPQS